MVQGVNSKHSRLSSSMSLASTEQSARFVCSAERLDRAVASRKHTFTAEHAEKLMKKHMRKRSSPLTISCVKDRILFTSENDLQSSKSWRTHAKYADIRHIYIYSLNPRLFVLCVEDSEHKNKKYYESYRCSMTQDVNSLCELTASAKQTLTNTLPPIDIDDDSGLEENLARSIEPNVANSVSHLASSYDSGSEQEYKQSGNVPSSRFAISPETKELEVQQSPSEHYNGVRHSGALKEYAVRPVRSLQMESVPSVAENVQTRYSSPDKPRVYNVPSVTICNNRHPSQTQQDIFSKDVKRESKAVYRSYQPSNNHVYRNNTDYGPAELRQILGDDLTYIAVDRKNGTSMCDRGPIYMYALRLTDSVQSYYGNDLVSATNSPKTSY